jgi:hypothetical protein
MMPAGCPPGGGQFKGQRSVYHDGFKNIRRRGSGLMDSNQSNPIVTLTDSLNPLKLRFNNNMEKIRFVALLSPTCPL